MLVDRIHGHTPLLCLPFSYQGRGGFGDLYASSIYKLRKSRQRIESWSGFMLSFFALCIISGGGLALEMRHELISIAYDLRYWSISSTL